MWPSPSTCSSYLRWPKTDGRHTPAAVGRDLLVRVRFCDLDLLADSAMTLTDLVIAEFLHERHSECTLGAPCRAGCVLIAIADRIAPEGDPDLAQIRSLLLADVH